MSNVGNPKLGDIDDIIEIVLNEEKTILNSGGLLPSKTNQKGLEQRKKVQWPKMEFLE